MNWSDSFTYKAYISVVDASTWKDIEVMDVTSISIKRSDSDLRQSADISGADYNEVKDIWVRVWLDVKQDSESEHIPLFTGTTAPSKKEIKGGTINYSMPCYSVLTPAQDILLPRGWYVPTETNGAEIVKSLLSVGPAPVNIIGEAPHLTEAIIAEENENNLSMADKILTAMDWILTINGLGEITISPKETEPVVTYDSVFNDVIEPQITINYDWYNCPNVFRASIDSMSAVARDDDPDSILSTISRGREIWYGETNCDLNEDESLAEYAARRLKEEQNCYISLSYDVRFNPDVNINSIIRLNYPAQSLTGKYLVTSQSIDINPNLKVSEEVIGQ